VFAKAYEGYSPVAQRDKLWDMPGKSRLTTTILWCFLVSSLTGQVVFSRRVYQEKGRSYQQIWTWNPEDGALRALTQSPRNHYLPECTDGKTTFVSPEPWQAGAKLWSFDRATGEERVIGPAPASPVRKTPPDDCEAFAKRGALEACGKKDDVLLTRAGKPAGQFHLPLDEYDARMESMTWSPDGKWLLVDELGEHTNSTSPQSDFYVIDPATKKISKAASASQALWLPGRDELLYTTPRDMAELRSAGRTVGVWAQQLMRFDLATGKTTTVTSGVTNNLEASWCGR
jgi:hypothetical protein